MGNYLGWKMVLDQIGKPMDNWGFPLKVSSKGIFPKNLRKLPGIKEGAY